MSTSVKKKRHSNDGLRKVCGCARRRWLKCPHPWHVNFKLKGGEHLRKSDKLAGKHIAGKDDAKKILEKLRTDLRDGKLITVKRNGRVDVAPPTAPVVDTLTVDQLLEQFITRHVALSPRTRSRKMRAARSASSSARNSSYRPGSVGRSVIG